MQTDGLAQCPSSSVAFYATTSLQVKFGPVQRDRASQVALSSQLNQGQAFFWLTAQQATFHSVTWVHLPLQN